MPNFLLLAGPNGAGKSTSAPQILSGDRKVDEFLNADVIAQDQGLSDVAAGRQTLSRLQALERVAKRVATGGHSIPEDVIRRRYERGLENFFNAYSLAADTWVMVDNTRPPGRPIAWRRLGESIYVLDNPLWIKLAGRYMKPRAEQPQAAIKDADEVERLRRIFDPADIVRAVNRAVSEALRRHKQRGESVVIWRDGKIVELKAEEIDV